MDGANGIKFLHGGRSQLQLWKGERSEDFLTVLLHVDWEVREGF